MQPVSVNTQHQLTLGSLTYTANAYRLDILEATDSIAKAMATGDIGHVTFPGGVMRSMQDDEESDDQPPTMIMSSPEQSCSSQWVKCEEEDTIILNGRIVVVEDEQVIKLKENMGGGQPRDLPPLVAESDDDNAVPETWDIPRNRSPSPPPQDSSRCRSLSASPTLSEDEDRKVLPHVLDPAPKHPRAVRVLDRNGSSFRVSARPAGISRPPQQHRSYVVSAVSSMVNQLTTEEPIPMVVVDIPSTISQGSASPPLDVLCCDDWLMPLVDSVAEGGAGNLFILDSAASVTVCRSAHRMTNIQAFVPGQEPVLTSATGNTFTATMHGSMTVRILAQHSHTGQRAIVELRMHNVLLMEESEYNIISMADIVYHDRDQQQPTGNIIIMGGARSYIQLASGWKIYMTLRSNNLFTLDVVDEQREQEHMAVPSVDVPDD